MQLVQLMHDANEEVASGTFVNSLGLPQVRLLDTLHATLLPNA